MAEYYGKNLFCIFLCNQKFCVTVEVTAKVRCLVVYKKCIEAICKYSYELICLWNNQRSEHVISWIPRRMCIPKFTWSEKPIRNSVKLWSFHCVHSVQYLLFDDVSVVARHNWLLTFNFEVFVVEKNFWGLMRYTGTSQWKILVLWDLLERSQETL